MPAAGVGSETRAPRIDRCRQCAEWTAPFPDVGGRQSMTPIARCPPTVLSQSISEQGVEAALCRKRSSARRLWGRKEDQLALIRRVIAVDRRSQERADHR